MFCVTLILFMRSSVKDCGGCVNHGTSGGDSKENARCLADAEYGDKSYEERGGDNDE